MTKTNRAVIEALIRDAGMREGLVRTAILRSGHMMVEDVMYGAGHGAVTGATSVLTHHDVFLVIRALARSALATH